MIGLQGQVSRLEISSTVIDYEGEPALLITGARSCRRRPCAADTVVAAFRTGQHGANVCICRRSLRLRRPSLQPICRAVSAT